MTVPAVAPEIAPVSSAVVSTTTVAACACPGRTARPAPSARTAPRTRAVRRDMEWGPFVVLSGVTGGAAARSRAPAAEIDGAGVPLGLRVRELGPVLRDGDRRAGAGVAVLGEALALPRVGGGHVRVGRDRVD